MLIKPEYPVKHNCEFLGWTENGEEFDFESPIEKDITLVATWREYEKYNLPVYGFYCAIKEKISYGGYSQKDIKKVYNDLEFICYIGAEIIGNEHYFRTIMYQLEYGNGFKLLKANDSATVENNIRKIKLEIPSAMHDEIEYTFKVIDA